MSGVAPKRFAIVVPRRMGRRLRARKSIVGMPCGDVVTERWTMLGDPMRSSCSSACHGLFLTASLIETTLENTSLHVVHCRGSHPPSVIVRLPLLVSGDQRICLCSSVFTVCLKSQLLPNLLCNVVCLWYAWQAKADAKVKAEGCSHISVQAHQIASLFSMAEGVRQGLKLCCRRHRPHGNDSSCDQMFSALMSSPAT